jgi:hypothetical protein
MKPHSKKHLLTVLLVWVLLGISACGGPQPVGETPGVSVQPSSPPAGEVPQPVIVPSSESSDSVGSYDCAGGGDPHPIGENIAATYEVSYQQVMAWFCSGYSFENILIALETSEAVDIPAETLLQMLLEKDWEEIWVEVGFTDSP